MGVIRRTEKVIRYFTKGEFNPRSKNQLLSYMESIGDEGGELTDTGKQSTTKKVMEGLARKNSFYRDHINYTAIGKVRSTYVDKAEAMLDAEDRIHAEFRDVPSTGRLSCTRFNITNVVADKDDEQTEAAGFRECVEAEEGCELIEADAAAVEAVFAGYCMKDPNYIRLAQLGVHDYLTSHMVGKPASLEWPNERLGEYFKWIKSTYKKERHLAKKTVHAVNFLQSPYGMAKTSPEIFTLALATELRNLYLRICPKLGPWQKELQLAAHKQGYVGLDDTPGAPGMSPWKYRHWFWNVYAWNPKKQAHDLGKDAKRVVAWQPQHMNAGFQKEVALRVEPRVRTLFHGRTPLRGLIHDSILCEVEEQHRGRLVKVLYEEMTRPIKELPCPKEWGLGEFLSIGCSVKVGKNWAEWDQEGNPEGMKAIEEELGTASDTAVREWEEEEGEDVGYV